LSALALERWPLGWVANTVWRIGGEEVNKTKESFILLSQGTNKFCKTVKISGHNSVPVTITTSTRLTTGTMYTRQQSILKRVSLANKGFAAGSDSRGATLTRLPQKYRGTAAPLLASMIAR
jgi:hypothetical protein